MDDPQVHHPRAFHRLAGDLDQTMLAVTTVADGEPSGCLVGFSTQCSIGPPRFLVLLSDKNHTYRVAQRAEFLAIHPLQQRNRQIAELFGEETGDEIDKFARCRWSFGPQGMPILEDCPSWFVGRVLDRIPFGDHVGHVLEPVAAAHDEPLEPLTLHDVLDLRPGHDA